MDKTILKAISGNKELIKKLIAGEVNEDIIKRNWFVLYNIKDGFESCVSAITVLENPQVYTQMQLRARYSPDIQILKYTLPEDTTLTREEAKLLFTDICNQKLKKSLEEHIARLRRNE